MTMCIIVKYLTTVAASIRLNGPSHPTVRPYICRKRADMAHSALTHCHISDRANTSINALTGTIVVALIRTNSRGDRQGGYCP